MIHGRAGRVIAVLSSVLVAAVTMLIPMEAADAAPRVSASKTNGLDPAGETIRVQGSGFDETKGIYLALCVKAPKATMAPGPCGGGGVLLDGSDGSSQWISSNPPSYGVGLAIPYGQGGSFDLTVHVSAIIQQTTATTPAVDCRVVACGITTRADHVRSGDRSQDYFIPVTFAGPPPTTAPPPTTQPTQPQRPATSQTPTAATNDTPAANSGGSASGSGWGAGQGDPRSATPGATGATDAPDQSGPIDEDTPVTIPSSLFGDGDPNDDPTSQDDDDSPVVTVKGESESPNSNSNETGSQSSKSQELALADGSSTSSNSRGWVLSLVVLIIAAGATTGGFIWRRRTVAADAAGDASQVNDK